MMEKYFTGISVLIGSIIIFTGMVMTRGGANEIFVSKSSEATQGALVGVTGAEALTVSPSPTNLEPSPLPSPEEVKPSPSPSPSPTPKATPKPTPKAVTPPAPKPTPAPPPPPASKPTTITLPNGDVVQLDANGNVISSTPAPASTPAPTTNNNTGEIVTLPNGTKINKISGEVVYRAPGDSKLYKALPTGAITDTQGNLVLTATGKDPAKESTGGTPASAQATPSPSPAAPTPPAIGSTVNIAQSLLDAMAINPSVSCGNMGFSLNDKMLCDLYRNNKASYTWNIVN